MSNKLMIAAAGSGKTTYLVNEALRNTDQEVLITTYTEANETGIREKIIQINKCIPANITIQTWFSFLLQHGIKPYQGALNDTMFNKTVAGMVLVNKQSGVNYMTRGRPVYFAEDSDFKKHYFTKNWHVYSDKMSKFVFKCDQSMNGEVMNRLSRIYSHIYIDEIQDLAGYDLELIKLLFKTSSSVCLVGDPRQVTYLTHHSTKNRNFKDGKIKEYVEQNTNRNIQCEIDEQTLNVSHRNNSFICSYSSKLYPDLPVVEPCECESCRAYEVEHEGVFLIKPNDVDSYLAKYTPIQLRWNSTKSVHTNYKAMNLGQSKGLTFDRVLIYPTTKMTNWITDNSETLNNEARAKLYVGITRARYSVAIVMNYDDIDYNGLEKYIPEE